VSPNCTEKIEIANSGNDVIIESIKKPMANCPIPVISAIFEAESDTISLDLTSTASEIKRIKNCVTSRMGFSINPFYSIPATV
jgi:hypothetical protein